MLDSPYVRRVAITLKRLGLPFEHRPVSVFSAFEEFRIVNPVVKAPTLVCDAGEVLMDSSLIIDYLEALAAPGNRLMPASLPERVRSLRLTGLALAACEKAVQLVYEEELRPAERRHAPWVERVSLQLRAACGELEGELQRKALQADESIGQDGISAAVAWRFIQLKRPGQLDPAAFPLLARFSAEAEALEIFRSTPAD
jgi:glutathione S-transferase